MIIDDPFKDVSMEESSKQIEDYLKWMVSESNVFIGNHVDGDLKKHLEVKHG